MTADHDLRPRCAGCMGPIEGTPVFGEANLPRHVSCATPRFYRVTLDGRSFWLRVVSETESVVVGTEVRVDGDEVVPPGRDADGRRFTDRMHFIERSQATFRPAAMNPKYAELEVVSAA